MGVTLANFHKQGNFCCLIELLKLFIIIGAKYVYMSGASGDSKLKAGIPRGRVYRLVSQEAPAPHMHHQYLQTENI